MKQLLTSFDKRGRTRDSEVGRSRGTGGSIEPWLPLLLRQVARFVRCSPLAHERARGTGSWRTFENLRRDGRGASLWACPGYSWSGVLVCEVPGRAEEAAGVQSVQGGCVLLEGLSGERLEGWAQAGLQGQDEDKGGCGRERRAQQVRARWSPWDERGRGGVLQCHWNR